MDVFERVYYMRVILGVAAGMVAGLIIPVEFDQNSSVGIAVLLAFVFYIVSFGVGKSIARNVPRDKRRKIATEGIIPFIFLLLTFMIITYTALHQSVLT